MAEQKGDCVNQDGAERVCESCNRSSRVYTLEVVQTSNVRPLLYLGFQIFFWTACILSK